MITYRFSRQRNRRFKVLYLAVIIALLVSLFPQVVGQPIPTALAHNLQTRFVYMYMDSATQAMLDARMAAPGWLPPTALLQVNDELGIVIKVMPKDGTNTGVGGHVDFYVPNGVTVLDAAYVIPDGAGGYVQVAMKGQSPIAIGDGPIGAKTTTEMAGIPAVGPNINNVTELPATAGGLHRGTLAGVYGDTGIFYSTDPDTAYGSWQKFTGDWNASGANQCGSLAFSAANGKTITNNSGDSVVPCNKWDAEQLFAWGAKATAYSTVGWPHIPIVDYGDGRGNAPWGFAAGAAGPQSGYAWNFDWDEWLGSARDKPAVQAAMDNDEIGPWQRIMYFGSRISTDQPGLTSTAIGYANRDASTVGVDLTAGDLPATVSQTDSTSPKVIRWAVGQLTQYRPEYVWVKVKVNSVAEIVNPSGCPVFHGDTFGGDAGGTDNGKDHLWRYYEPTEASWNGCLAAGKIATKEFVKIGDTFQYKLHVYNFQNFTLTNVVVRDTLPSGVQILSAAPAQNSGPNPLVWNVGTLLPGQKWEALVAVKATGSGPLDNCLDIDSGQLPRQTVCDSTQVGSYPYLVPTKTGSATAVTPGQNVQYTITVKNIGTGPTASPVTIDEYLPTGFTFVSKDSVTVNGADMTVATSVTTAIPYSTGQPRFSVPAAIAAGQPLVIKFSAKVPANAAAGSYCNYFSTIQGGIPLTTGSLACVTVGGGNGKIGDTIFRDWNGNGAQDAGEEGIAGVTVTLTKPGGGTVTISTDANGQYLFTSLPAGSYTVSVPAAGTGGVPAGHVLTADPDGAPYNLSYVKALALDEVYLGADFGYQPTGSGSIGDQVFDDKDLSGAFNAGDVGIPNITVRLYEDGNGNGVIDAGDALVATTATSAGGTYNFNNLATGYKYLVDVDQSDPDLSSYFGGGIFTATTSDPHNVGALAGAYTAADFGFHKDVPAGTFSIGDQVFMDTNDNGTYQAGTDTPLPNVGLTLYQDLGTIGVLDAADVAIGAATTSITGAYTFANLPAGNYLVDINQADPDIPAGYALRSGTNDPWAVTLGPTNLNVDFPFVYVPPPPSPISKAVDKANANAGDTLNYTITTSYTGGSLLTNVTVTDTIPAGTKYVTDSDTPEATVTPADNATATLLTWNLGSNAAGIPGHATGVGTAQVTLDLPAQKDTYLANLGSAGNNFGACPGLGLANTTGTIVRRPLYQFDLSSIPSSCTVSAATMRLYASFIDAQPKTVDAHRVTSDWDEGTACAAAGIANWDNRSAGPVAWTTAGGDYASPAAASLTVASTTAAYYNFNLTTLAQGWVANTYTNYGVLLNQPTQAGAGEITWQSKNTGTPAYAPNLAITLTCPGDIAAALAHPTTGMAVWRSANLTTPKYNQWDGSAFGTAANSASVGTWRIIQGASAPTRNEKIVVGVNSSGQINGELWNGSAWSALSINQLNATAVSETYWWGFDVAYEQQSGDALLVWDNNTASNMLQYSVWNGSAWSAKTTISAYTGAEPQQMHLAAKPGSDEMVLVVSDVNADDYALVWSGSSWGNAVTLDTTGSTEAEQTAINVAYMHDSGHAMAAYGKSADPKAYYRLWDGSSWSSEASLDPSTSPVVSTCTPQWIELATDPSSDRIGMGVQTANCGSGNRLWSGVWDGATWASRVASAAQPTGYNYSNIAVAWESMSGQLLVAFGSGTATTVSYQTWSSAGLWSAVGTGPNVAAIPNSLTLDAHPVTNKIMLAAQNASLDLKYTLWDGSAWGAVSTQETNVVETKNQPFVFLWNHVVSVSSQVNASSDDAEEYGPGVVAPNTLGQMTLISTDLEMVDDIEPVSSGTQKIGMRFSNVGVPTGATIRRAYITFRAIAADAPNTNTGATNLTLRAQAADNPTTFTSTAYNISNRVTSTAYITWAPTSWASGTDYATPDLGPVVQEVVDRSGWTDGNSMVFIVTGSGSRSAESWDLNSGAGNAPELVIEYTNEPSGPSLGNVITAAPTLVTAGSTITVTMALTSSQSIAGVSPGALTITPTNGVSAVLLTGPNPASATIGASPTTFTWTYQATAGANIGQLTFGGGANDGGSNTWPWAQSNSVIVHPPLTFQVTVNNPATVNPVTNTAYIKDASVIPLSPSNTVQTTIGASIGDRVWADLDGGADQDVGEPGISGVQVCASPLAGGTGGGCATTDNQGIYHIVGLTNGVQYSVTLTSTTIPANYQPTTATTLVRTSTTVGVTDADFGLRPPGTASIGDTVCLDTGENGCGVGDAGLPNITVKLYKDMTNNGLTGDDLLMATKTTDANGLYSFAGLYAGDYLVQIAASSVVTTPYGVTTTLVAALDLVSGANPHDVTLANGQAYITADFGYNWGGSIGNYVWWDNDAEGDQDEALPIANAVVLLYYDANNNGFLDLAGQPGGDTQVGFTMTDASGLYLFDNLAPGKYLADVYEDSITTDGVRDAVPTTSDVVFVNLSPNQDVLTADFGYYEGARVEGNVFWDEDRNGILDSNERDPAHLLPNITVTLTCAGPDGILGNGDDVTQTKDTSANGHYAFLTPANPCTLTYDAADIPPALLDATTPINYTFTAEAGADWHPSFDFGVDNTAAIGDTIFVDANGNGVQDDGEPGLANTTVYLYQDVGVIGVYEPGIDIFLAGAGADAQGKYLFEGLPDDNYQVRVNTLTLPTDYVQMADPDQPGIPCTTCNNVAAAVTSGGSDLLTRDFGYQYQPGGNVNATRTVSGVLWNDLDGDGVHDAGEPVFTGVSVVVDCGPNGTFIATTGALALGRNWSVAGIPFGSNCTITPDPTTLPLGFDPTTVTTRTVTNVQTDVSGQNFGYWLQPSSLSGQVVIGTGNGRADPGEPPLSGVLVTLRFAGADGILGTTDDTLASTTTDATGAYTFTNLLPGLYQVVEINPANYSSVADRDFGNPDNITLTLSSNQNVTGRDFEDAPLPGAIGNRVWLDENGNGIQDAGEAGIANVTVQLWNSTHTALLASTTTDAAGGYLFTNVAPGTYQVDVLNSSLASGLVQTTIPAGGGDFVNHADPFTVSVSANGENLSADFGFDWAPSSDVTGNTGAGAIGDRVWIDADGDGVQDPGELGLNGVTVTLYSDPDHNGVYDTVVGTTTTGPAGNYIFDGVAAGAYVVAVTPPPGYAQSGDPDANLDNRTTAPVILAPGDVYVNADFGYNPTSASASTIGDRVWLDADADGVQDAGEPGTPGVTVTLIRDTNNNNLLDAGDTIIATDVTNASGNYTFDDVPNGAYLVWVNDTNAVLSALAQTYDSDGLSTTNLTQVDVLVSGSYLAHDFGYTPAEQTAGEGLIGDTVFLDRNNNGAFDVGEGMEGVTVTLTGPGGSQQVVTTDENGNYVFGNLPAGAYTVTVSAGTLPTGMTNTVDPDGGNNSQSVVTLAAGASNFSQDFGYRGTTPGSIGNSAWNDLDGDGAKDAGEPGINGITMDLYRDLNSNNVLDAGDALVATTTTDASGSYSFTSLATDDGGGNAQYLVVVADANAVLTGWWHSTGTPNTDNQSQTAPYPVTLAPGATSNQTADFGFFRAGAALGNFVWHDLDGNGIQGVGEPGLGTPVGVTVTLTINWPNGSASTLAVVSAANGSYSFSNLFLDENMDGTGAGEPVFTLSATPLAGYSPSPANQGGNDLLDSDGASVNATVVRGQTDVALSNMTGVNASYDFGFARQVSVNGMAYLDTNHNGIHDPGENAGIPGVSITIQGPNGLVIATTTTITGYYSVGNLPAGTYTITAPATTLSVYGLDSQNPLVVTLGPGQTGSDLDFGYLLATGFTVVNFTAQWQGNLVVVRWIAINEGALAGYHIYRSTDPDGSDLLRVTQQMVPVATGTYQINDTTAVRGQPYWYWVQTQPDELLIGPYPMTVSSKIFIPVMRK